MSKTFVGSSSRITRFLFNKPEADVRAVSDIDLEVRSGEIMAVMGPNGAGKTTLVKMLCTLLLPTSGEAQVRGIDVCRNPDAVRRQIAYITGDERSFYWRLSGRQNLQFFGGLNGLSSTELKTKIHTTCEALGITDLLDRRFDSYSTGIRQKFAIARGLLNNASVLFLDEPTRSLDPGSSHGLLSILRNDIAKSQNRTVILVTHRLDEAQTTCDRLLVMKNGRCAFLGEPSEFLNLAAFSGWQIEVKDFSDQAMDALKRLPLKSVYHTDTPLDKKGTEKQAALQVETIPETDLSIGDIAAVLVSHGARVTDITKMIQKPSDVFADLVEEDESGEAES